MKGSATLRNGGLKLRTLRLDSDVGRIRNAVIPSSAVFPLLQHTGEAAECIVAPGDRVREGMMIARACGPISSAVHSSIPGVVADRRVVRLPNGEHSDAVIVTLEGTFERLGPSRDQLYATDDLRREDLLARLSENGVVSMDSDAVPLHALWEAPRGTRVDTLLVNALRGQPYLAVEPLLARERAQDLVEGLAIAVNILNPRTVILVSEESLPVPADIVENANASGIALSTVEYGPKYPQGEQRELARAVTGRQIPEGASPMSCGVYMTNVSTLVAVRDAIIAARPLFERYVTVAGGAIREPATLRVRIGTPIRDLVEECGGFGQVPERVVVGGPFTGSVVYDLDTPVLKNTDAVIALTKREANTGDRVPCINCGRCLTACPERLNPARIFKAIEHDRDDDALAAGLLSCSECGGCSYVCPSHIPLRSIIRDGKRRVRLGEKRE